MLEFSNDLTRKRLMKSFSELEKVLNYLDSDLKENDAVSRLGDYQEMQMLKKASLTINELTG